MATPTPVEPVIEPVIEPAVEPVVVLVGFPRVHHVYNAQGNLMAGVEVTLNDGSVLVSDSEGHIIAPSDAEFTCTYRVE